MDRLSWALHGGHQIAPLIKIYLADIAAGDLLDIVQPKPLGNSRYQGEGDPVALGPAGAADAVDIVFVLVRDIIVKDGIHIVDIQPTGSHIGGYQYPELAVSEFLERLFPLALLDIAVDGLAGDAPHAHSRPCPAAGP